MVDRTSPRRSARALALTLGALLAGAAAPAAFAQDVADPVDPLEDRALREEAQAKFDQALEDFRKAFDAAIEQAQQGGDVREMNLARAEVLLEKLDSLSEQTTRQGETEKFLSKYDASKAGPLLDGHVRWLRARFLMSQGDRDGAAAVAAPLGFVRDWWVIGPFDNERGRNFRKAEAVEKGIDLDQELKGKERDVRWRKVPVQPMFGLVDLDALLRPNDQCLAYAVAFVRSDAAKDAAVRIGSDEALKAWWNGREIVSRDVRRELGFDQDVAGVRLNAGWNVLLLKVHDQTGAWSFRCRLTAPDGGPLEGVTFAADDAAAREAAKGAGAAAEPQAAAAVGARAWFEKTTSGDAKKARDLFHLGWLHHRREFDSIADRRAETLLKQAADAEPTNAVYRFHYAEAAAPKVEMDVEKEENRQRRGREAAIQADPGYAVAYRALADFYTHSLTSLERAEELLRKAIEINPDYLEARMDLANCLQRRGLLAQAELERKRVLEHARAKGLESAARVAAHQLETQGMGPEAMDAWKQVLQLDQRGNDVRRKVAELAAAALRRDEALAVLDAIAAVSPYDLSALSRKAELLEGTDDFAGAETALRKALEIAPEDDELLRHLARVQAKSGRRDEALKTFRAALAVNPKLQDVERYVEFLDPAAAPFEDDYVVDVAPLVEKAAAWRNDENDATLTVFDQTVTKVNRDGTSASYVRQVHKILTEAGVKEYDRFRAQGWGQLKWKWARVLRDGQHLDAKISGSVADFPPLRVGDVVDAAWRRDEREQGVFGDYFGDWQFFASYVPTLRTEYTLITPAEREFYFHQKHFDAKPEVAEKEKDGQRLRVYTWRNVDVPKVRYEDGMPGERETFPQVQVTTYKDWGEFSRWWSAMIKDQRLATDDIKQKVAEITKDKATRFDKVRAIYEFVTGEITYQAWPFGPHGYKPYAAQAIFEKREGDCKDKSILISAMLQEIGVESYPVLIYADMGRDEDDLTLAQVGAFNHCIAYVPDADGAGRSMFLDGTAQYHSIEVPPAMDRGAKVLIVKPDGAEVAKIHEGSPADFGFDQTWKVTVETDGTGVLEGEVRWKGDMATQMRSQFSVEGQRPMVLQMLFTQIFGKAKLEKHEFSDLKDLSKPEATFRVTLRVPNFAKKDGDAYALPAAFVEGLFAGMFKQMATRPEREHDLVLPFPMGLGVDVTYLLPEGWTVEQKPEDADLSASAAKFTSKAAQTGREVRLERRFEITGTRVKKTDYAGFRDLVTRSSALFAQRFKVRPGAAPAKTDAAPPADAPKTPSDLPK